MFFLIINLKIFIENKKIGFPCFLLQNLTLETYLKALNYIGKKFQGLQLYKTGGNFEEWNCILILHLSKHTHASTKAVAKSGLKTLFQATRAILFCFIIKRYALAFALLKEIYHYHMHAFANNGLGSEDPACMLSPTCYAVMWEW